MAHYTAEIVWQRGPEEDFLDNRYNRRHELRFDGGAVVPGSSSPHVVKLPFSDPTAVDPEEAFVASLSSCHMLWFLSLAAQAGWRVNRYVDKAEGEMGKNAQGQIAMLRVTLRPQVTFDRATQPSTAEHEALHHQAHEQCFIANSVKSELRCEPTLG